MKAYITKYALTKGIFEINAPISNGVVLGPDIFEHYHGEGMEWHRTRSEAINHAEVMRSNEIASLREQIEKLEKLRFV